MIQVIGIFYGSGGGGIAYTYTGNHIDHGVVDGYRLIELSSSGTLTVDRDCSVEAFLAAGGMGGGTGYKFNSERSGGKGGGGLYRLSGATVSKDTAITCVVGAGQTSWAVGNTSFGTLSTENGTGISGGDGSYCEDGGGSNYAVAGANGPIPFDVGLLSNVCSGGGGGGCVPFVSFTGLRAGAAGGIGAGNGGNSSNMDGTNATAYGCGGGGAYGDSSASGGVGYQGVIYLRIAV